MTADTDDEFMSAEEIAKAEKYFTENQGKIDEKHSFRPTEGLSVVDSWIQKCDCTIEGNVIKAGTWLMTVKCDNDKVWDKVQKGEYTGFSMGGKGIFSSVDVSLEKSEEEEGLYIVEGPRIERMLGYTNLDSEKGFEFFQKFLKTNGILDELEKLGIEEGDTVKMYGWQFEFMR